MSVAKNENFTQKFHKLNSNNFYNPVFPGLRTKSITYLGKKSETWIYSSASVPVQTCTTACR